MQQKYVTVIMIIVFLIILALVMAFDPFCKKCGDKPTMSECRSMYPVDCDKECETDCSKCDTDCSKCDNDCSKCKNDCTKCGPKCDQCDTDCSKCKNDCTKCGTCLTDEDLGKYGYMGADKKYYLGNDNRKYSDSYISVTQNGVPYKIVNPRDTYVLLSNGDSYNTSMKLCPSGTYGPNCDFKYCPYDIKANGGYSFWGANDLCKKNTGFGCNAMTGKCDAKLTPDITSNE